MTGMQPRSNSGYRSLKVPVPSSGCPGRALRLSTPLPPASGAPHQKVQPFSRPAVLREYAPVIPTTPWRQTDRPGAGTTRFIVLARDITARRQADLDQSSLLEAEVARRTADRKSTRLNSSHPS